MFLTKKDTLVLLLCTASAGIGMGGLVAHHLEAQMAPAPEDLELAGELALAEDGDADDPTDDDTDADADALDLEDALAAGHGGIILIEAENVAFASPEVFVDGVATGFQDLGLGLVVSAPPGKHRLRLKDGDMVQNWDVDLDPRDPHTHVQFSNAQATLVIGTNPKGVLLTVNGRDVMMATPVPANAPLRLRAGMHTIRFTQGAAHWDYAVHVPKGESSLFIPELGRDATVGHAWVSRR